MDQRLKVKLDDLPGSQSDYWKDAEVHTGIKPHNEFSEGGHFFIRTTGRQAQCTHCYWGFELDPGDKIVDGHLYDRNGKLVI